MVQVYASFYIAPRTPPPLQRLCVPWRTGYAGGMHDAKPPYQGLLEALLPAARAHFKACDDCRKHLLCPCSQVKGLCVAKSTNVT